PMLQDFRRVHLLQPVRTSASQNQAIRGIDVSPSDCYFAGFLQYLRLSSANAVHRFGSPSIQRFSELTQLPLGFCSATNCAPSSARQSCLFPRSSVIVSIPRESSALAKRW